MAIGPNHVDLLCGKGMNFFLFHCTGEALQSLDEYKESGLFMDNWNKFKLILYNNLMSMKVIILTFLERAILLRKFL